MHDGFGRRRSAHVDGGNVAESRSFGTVEEGAGSGAPLQSLQATLRLSVKESLNPDTAHGPHWDYHRREPGGGQWRLYPDGGMEPK